MIWSRRRAHLQRLQDTLQEARLALIATGVFRAEEFRATPDDIGPLVTRPHEHHLRLREAQLASRDQQIADLHAHVAALRTQVRQLPGGSLRLASELARARRALLVLEEVAQACRERHGGNDRLPAGEPVAEPL